MFGTAKRLGTIAAALLATAILAGCGGGGGGGGSGNTGGGGSPGERSSDNDSALLSAALNGQANAVRRLLAAGADLNARDGDGDTPLHLAALGGDADTVKILLDAGADVSARDDRVYWTPLLAAAARGHAGVVRQLLDAGADPDAETRDGITALDLAEGGGHADVAGILRNAGSMAGSDTGMTGAGDGDVNRPSPRGGTPIAAPDGWNDPAQTEWFGSPHRNEINFPEPFGARYAGPGFLVVPSSASGCFGGDSLLPEWGCEENGSAKFTVLHEEDTPSGKVTLLYATGYLENRVPPETIFSGTVLDTRNYRPPSQNVAAIFGYTDYGSWMTGWQEIAVPASYGFQTNYPESLKGWTFGTGSTNHYFGGTTFASAAHEERLQGDYRREGETWSATYRGLMGGIAHRHGNRPVTGRADISAEFARYLSGIEPTSFNISLNQISGGDFTIGDIVFSVEEDPYGGRREFEVPPGRADDGNRYLSGSFIGPGNEAVHGVFSTPDVSGGFGALQTGSTNRPPVGGDIRPGGQR